MHNRCYRVSIFAFAAMLGACGEAPKDKTSVGEHLFSLTGTVAGGSEDLVADIAAPVQVAAVWVKWADAANTADATAAADAEPSRAAMDSEANKYSTFSEVFVAQTVDVEQVQLPATFTLKFRELPPESMMTRSPSGLNHATAILVAYEDLNGDGQLNLPDRTTKTLADRILNMSEYETLIVYVEGEVPPTIDGPKLVVSLPESLQSELGDLYYDINNGFTDAALARRPPQVHMLNNNVTVDRLSPGFNLFKDHPLLANYKKPHREQNDCWKTVYYRELSTEDATALCASYENVTFKPFFELQTCAEMAGDDQHAKRECVASYEAAMDPLFESPTFQRQDSAFVVELPIRDIPFVGERFCPLPESDTDRFAMISEIGDEHITCAADGRSFTIDPLKPSEYPTYCYPIGGVFSDISLSELGSAENTDTVPDWWPCL